MAVVSNIVIKSGTLWSYYDRWESWQSDFAWIFSTWYGLLVALPSKVIPPTTPKRKMADPSSKERKELLLNQIQFWQRSRDPPGNMAGLRVSIYKLETEKRRQGQPYHLDPLTAPWNAINQCMPYRTWRAQYKFQHTSPWHSPGV